MKSKVEKKVLVPKLRFPEFDGDVEWQRPSIIELIEDDVLEPPRDGNHGNIHPKSSDFVSSGIPFIMASDLTDGMIDFDNCHYITRNQADSLKKGFAKEGDVLLSHKGTVGEVALILKISWDYIMLTPQVTYYRVKNKKKLFNVFLAYYFKTRHFQSALAEKSGGGTRAYVGITEQSKLFALLTKPLEQQKIADCLSSLDDLITAETERYAALQDHKKGLMQQLFPAESQTTPKRRFPEFEGEWDDDNLITIAKFRRGSFPQPYGLAKWYDQENGTPFIQVYDVGENLELKGRTKNKISAEAKGLSLFILAGTLIVTIQGSIGRVAITQYDACIDRTLLIFEEFLIPIDKHFFACLLQNLFEIEKKKAPGGVIKTITKEVLSKFVVKYPCDMQEQKKVASCLISLDNLISAQAHKIEALKDHKKGLLQQLFPSADLT